MRATTGRRVADAVSARSRARKAEYLLEQIGDGASVLLVGVASGAGVAARNTVEAALAAGRRAVCVCYEQPAAPPIVGVPTVRADGRALPFADRSFDYVVSNAVIEHLGGRYGAERLLAESARIARFGYFHTTPNRRFPIETHTLLPVLHWLPRRWQTRTFAVARRRFPPSHYWLFTARTLRALRPQARVVRLGRSPVAMTLVVAERQERRSATRPATSD